MAAAAAMGAASVGLAAAGAKATGAAAGKTVTGWNSKTTLYYISIPPEQRPVNLNHALIRN
jgi:ABC-type glycerol-3-phosphate transport system substrate-binding protein